MDDDLRGIERVNRAARLVNEQDGVPATLDAIVTQARAMLPGIDHVGVSVTRDGRMDTLAATDDLVLRLDERQSETGQGPCLTAMLEDETVVVEHIRHDQRWPDFIPYAVQQGLRSQLGVRLYSTPSGIGGLNLYSTSQDTLHPELAAMAELFAVHATLALGHAQRHAQLEEALSSRSTIGTALGILMERFSIDEERAFEYLVRQSSTTNVKLRDVAAALVAETRSEAQEGGSGPSSSRS